MKTRVGSDRNRGTFTESVLAKGIRVNQLAKELGVESKAILAKCRDEGLADKVPNHMSVLSIGLAETVREWFSAGQGGVATAVEIAPPVEVKPKKRTVRKKETGAAAPTDEEVEHAPAGTFEKVNPSKAGAVGLEPEPAG